MRRALAALALIGCAGPTEPAVESEHFRVHADPGAVCPQITGWLEHHAQVFEAIFGVDAGVIDYELYPDTVSLGATGCATLGCSGAGTIRSIFPVHAHELVHAFAEPAGEPPHLLSEGLAGVFGCNPSEPPLAAIDRGAIDALLESSGFDAATARGEPSYAIAASLVRHLLDRFGDRAVLELYARLRHDDTAPEIAATFAAVLGVDLAAELDRWAADPPARICRRDVECSMFEVPAATEISAELMCGRFGPPAELPLTIELGEPAVIAVDVAGAGVRTVSVGSCDGGAAVAIDGAPVALEAGRHQIRITGDRPGAPIRAIWRRVP